MRGTGVVEVTGSESNKRRLARGGKVGEMAEGRIG